MKGSEAAKATWLPTPKAKAWPGGEHLFSFLAVGPDDAAIPRDVSDFLAKDLDIKLNDQVPEWSPEEVYVGLPRPGGDAWLRIELENGEIEYELTSRGWIAYFNDLHKGRNTGTAWNWFIDVFAVVCLIFCVTGLFLLKMHAGKRPSTWPVVVFGLVLPLILALMFIH